MASSSPNTQQSSDLDQGGEGDTSDDDGEAIEVDPLTFCQPEMSSGGQGDFEESYEEQESDDDDHEKTSSGNFGVNPRKLSEEPRKPETRKQTKETRKPDAVAS